MLAETNISGTQFCAHHHIEISFLHSLHDYGLIEIIIEEDDCFLHPEHLDTIEKLIRLHHDLHINMEGIDVIQNLLQRVEDMQGEISFLKNKLKLYENNS